MHTHTIPEAPGASAIPGHYSLILAQLTAVTETQTDTIANLSNASAVLNMNLDHINWVGFYLVRQNALILGPFQGRPACAHIPFGRGVCGTAAAEKTTQLVEDVHAFPGHIACDGASNSEIVVPIFHREKLVAVLDIDSPLYGRFDDDDREGLEKCAVLLGDACDWIL